MSKTRRSRIRGALLVLEGGAPGGQQEPPPLQQQQQQRRQSHERGPWCLPPQFPPDADFGSSGFVVELGGGADPLDRTFRTAVAEGMPSSAVVSPLPAPELSRHDKMGTVQ